MATITQERRKLVCQSHDLLSKNPAAAPAIHGNGSMALTYDYEHIMGLHYTHVVLNENMCLFPPV
jgi:hypothetical protein